MRISLIQMNSRAQGREENVERALDFVERAVADKAELAVLPEFFNREYFPQYRDYKYMEYAESDDGYTQTQMKKAARDHGIWIISTIFEIERPACTTTPLCLSVLRAKSSANTEKCTPRLCSVSKRSTSAVARHSRCSR